MSTFDTYRNEIRKAAWTWREEKVCPYHGPSLHKDRLSGRAAKRRASRLARKDMEREVTI